MNKKLGANAVYQTIYQILITITPLITAPFISRMLGAEGLGIYSYTLSIASYFMLFAMLGVTNYGCRTVAASPDNKEQRSKTFWNIFALQLFCSVLAVAGYFLYVAFAAKDNLLVALVQGVWVLSCALDINWFFFGIENFKVTVTRNIIVKIITVAAILVFVNKQTGVLMYTAIMAGGNFMSQAVLWPFLKKEIDWYPPEWKEVKRHIKPNLILFVPVIASSVYHVMDKTMLGALSTYQELGCYYNSDKVINIPIGIFNGLGTVFMARISSMAVKDSESHISRLLSKSLELYIFIGCALAFGIGSVSKEFIPVFFGAGYERCITLMWVFCPILIVKTYSIYMGTEYFLPAHMEEKYTVAIICGAAVNFVFNSLLIPRQGAFGAALGTLAAELSVTCILHFGYFRKSSWHDKKSWIKCTPYFVFGVIMYFAVRMASHTHLNRLAGLLFEIVVGAVCYLLLSAVYWRINPESGLSSIVKQSLRDIRKKLKANN